MKQFTADQHFNDRNILKYQYERIEKFGKTNKIVTKNLITTQNCQVDVNDTVYVIGDFIIGKKFDEIVKILNKLNGKIVLILGNHDIILYNKKISLPNKIIVHNEIITTTLYNGFKLYMFHYPLLEQPNYYSHNTYHLHGHSHGKMIHPDKRAIEVSCNLQDYKLLSENKIVEIFNKRCYN